MPKKYSTFSGVKMNYRHLGKAGLKLSELSLGAWVTFGEQIGEDAASACMKAAYENGVNFFDNAEAYAHGKAEIVMGNVLKKMGWPRTSYVVSTKIFWGGDGPNDTGLSMKHISEGVNNSLRRLQLEYVDLVYAHRPDPNTPLEETVRAFDRVIREGKAFYWGTSEWSAAEIMRADGLARQYGLTPPSMEQPQYNMLTRQRFEIEYAPIYRDLGYGTTIYSPLASGLLSGKYLNGIPKGSRMDIPDMGWLRDSAQNPEKALIIKNLLPVASQLDATLAQLALAWTLKNPHVSSVITGATRPEQVIENMKASLVADKLTPDIMEHIEGILGNRPEAFND
jgi:voltage-dependent potassium channel beta subunit